MIFKMNDSDSKVTFLCSWSSVQFSQSSMRILPKDLFL